MCYAHKAHVAGRKAHAKSFSSARSGSVQQGPHKWLVSWWFPFQPIQTPTQPKYLRNTRLTFKKEAQVSGEGGASLEPWPPHVCYNIVGSPWEGKLRLLEVDSNHSFQPSFFSKTSCFPRVLGGSLERRMPGKNGEGTVRKLGIS